MPPVFHARICSYTISRFLVSSLFFFFKPAISLPEPGQALIISQNVYTVDGGVHGHQVIILLSSSLRWTIGLYTADIERHHFLHAPHVCTCCSWLCMGVVHELEQERVRLCGKSCMHAALRTGLCPKLKVSGTSGNPCRYRLYGPKAYIDRIREIVISL